MNLPRLSDEELPALPGHPEPRTMRWSDLERGKIEAYGRQCAEAQRLKDEQRMREQKPVGYVLFDEEFGCKAGQLTEDLPLDTKLYAAPVPASQGDGWLSIETAPKVGEFLVWMPEEIHKVQAAWRNANGVFVIGGVFHFDTSKPTYWQPFPASPVTTKEAEG